MKKKQLLSIAVVLVLLAALVAGCSSQGSSANTTDASGNDDQTFVIGLDDSFPPMGFRDEQGNIVGFDIDLAQEAANRMGMTFKTQVVNWDTKELELENGNVDALWNGLSVTPEREEAMTLSNPYLENDQVVVVRNDSDIQTKADLAGKNVGLQKGSSAYDAFMADAIHDQVAAMNEYPENVSALQDLGIGRLDAVIVDSVVARYYISSESADYRILDDTLQAEQYAIAFKKGNTELADKVQQALDDMIADGTAAEISEKWFGEDIIYTGN